MRQIVSSFSYETSTRISCIASSSARVKKLKIGMVERNSSQSAIGITLSAILSQGDRPAQTDADSGKLLPDDHAPSVPGDSAGWHPPQVSSPVCSNVQPPA